MMKWDSLRLSTQLLVLIFVAVLAISSACATPASTPPATPTQPVAAPAPGAPTYNVNIAAKVGLGNYLVDAKGMTLYYFTKDSSGKSNASAAIIQIWPVFTLSNISLAPSLNAADFGIIVRDDGIKQVTFKGWPLYYYAKDLAPGDTVGQGLNKVWFIIDPANLQPAQAATSAPPPATTAPINPPPTSSGY